MSWLEFQATDVISAKAAGISQQFKRGGNEWSVSQSIGQSARTTEIDSEVRRGRSRVFAGKRQSKGRAVEVGALLVPPRLVRVCSTSTQRSAGLTRSPTHPLPGSRCGHPRAASICGPSTRAPNAERPPPTWVRIDTSTSTGGHTVAIADLQSRTKHQISPRLKFRRNKTKEVGIRSTLRSIEAWGRQFTCSALTQNCTDCKFLKPLTHWEDVFCRIPPS